MLRAAALGPRLLNKCLHKSANFLHNILKILKRLKQLSRKIYTFSQKVNIFT